MNSANLDRPWRVWGIREIVDCAGTTVALAYGPVLGPKTARLIVRAVNHHEALTKLVRAYLATADGLAVKRGKHKDLADIDTEARALLAQIDKGE